MKAHHLIFGLAGLFLALSACREITVRTTVDSDGTFTRMITVAGDSAEAFNQELPYPIDTTWTMSSKADTAGKGRFIVTYSKHFENSEELQAATRRDTSWKKQLKRDISIKKRFGFFYSHFEYREVYSAANPFTLLPYKDRLTPEDLLWITRKHPVQSPADSIKHKNAEDKALEYIVESASAEAEKILADGIRKLKDPSLDASRVSEFHDSITALLSNEKGPGGDALIEAYRRWTGNPVADRLKEIQPPIFGEFATRIRFVENVLGMEEFHTEAQLPGLITSTNSSALKGNQVTWDIFPMAFMLEDYTMEAGSRVMNVWAFVLSGLVLLGLVTLLAVRSFRK